MNRQPHCIGWYPQKLEEIKTYIPKTQKAARSNLSFAVVPHAGWIYSGKTAGAVYAALSKADTFIFLATNHTGMGPGTSVFASGVWTMPMGDFSVDEDCASGLLKHDILKADTDAHLMEHAVEVQLPFLSVLAPGAKIVPVEMRDYRLPTCKSVGAAVAEAVEEMLKKYPKRKIAVLASSDMTHCGASYTQPPPKGMTAGAFAKQQDRPAIDAMLEMDPEKLLKVVKEDRITMCGSGPAAAMIEAAKLLGARSAELLAYATSTDVSGEDSEIAVGYAGIVME